MKILECEMINDSDVIVDTKCLKCGYGLQYYVGKCRWLQCPICEQVAMIDNIFMLC